MKNELKMESTLLKKIKCYYLLHNKFLSVTKIFRTRQNVSLIIAASHMSCLLKKNKMVYPSVSKLSPLHLFVCFIEAIPFQEFVLPNYVFFYC